jgi:UDP-GlcNAc3NAcA epimerase
VRLLSVVGNRPQFIKSGPLSVALRDQGVDEVVVHTGQHYDRELSQVFFDELGLGAPAHRLETRSSDPDLMQPGLAAAIEAEQPDRVLVYGDTNSTLAGARAAARAHVPVAHVEAGLRSGDWSMPEERNRVEVDRLAALLLAPDDRSARILAGEEVRGRVEVVGDVMADACFTLAPLARERSHVLAEHALEPGGYVVATVHREANVDPERLRRIVEGFNRLDETVVFVAHPRTRSVVQENEISVGANVVLLPPLGYLDFAALASQARVILTESG